MTTETKVGETPPETSQQAPVEQKEPEPQPTVVEEKATTVSPAAVVSQVTDDNVQNQPAATTDDSVITITVPATTQQLEDWAKGSPDDSLTWAAFFWIRIIKKALFHGWRVVTATANPTAV